MPVSRRGLFGILAAAPAAVVGLLTAPARGGAMPSTGLHTIGERGPEAIVPLSRRSDGGLGIAGVDHVGEFVTHEQFQAALAQARDTAVKGARQALIERRRRGDLGNVF